MSAVRTPPRGGVVASTRAEGLRLSRWPAVWIIAGVWLVLALLFGYAFNYLSYLTGDTSFSNEDQGRAQLLASVLPGSVPEVLIQGMPLFGAALVLVLGALVGGGGYAWGTWKTVLGQARSRGAAVAGSLLALGVAVTLLVTVSLVLDVGVSCLIAVVESQPVALPGWGDVLTAFGAGFLVLQLWALLGYVLGVLTRGTSLAIGLGLVWALVVENLLRYTGSLLSWVDTLTHVLPGTAGGSLVGSIVGAGSGDTPGVLHTVDGTQAGLTVAAYVAALPVVAFVLVRARDVS